ncbi:MAG TPA: protein kinase [Thermoanaerobaculia bacterium]|nr:protein kinase [Thermoanaerobaculia bacterium]
MKPGDTLDGRYTITDRLGAGGMGEVYKATHTFLGSPRVIKVVHPHISGNTDARDRFLREARAATKVQHPNVATLHDFASLPDGAHYMVWEFIDGENLAQRLRTAGTLPPRKALRITIQALKGLDAIHRAGIIHRDISPENLMITKEDEVKIIDLGVAKVEDTEAVSQTRTGIFVGKLRYAAPEQLGFIPEGEKIDARADQYAMAMVLIELLTGRPPYEAKSPHEYFMLHAREPVKKTVELPRELTGSGALEEVLEKALSRDRNQRFASTREFAAALEEIERMLPDTREQATVSMPLPDGDETMRLRGTAVDTLHRKTESTVAPPPPPPAPVAAAPTVLTPLPAGQPTIAAETPKLRKGVNPAVLVAVIALIALAIGAVAFWPGNKETTTVADMTTSAPATAPATTVPQPPSQNAVGSITVTSEPEPAVPVTTTTSPELSAPVKGVVTDTTGEPEPGTTPLRNRMRDIRQQRREERQEEDAEAEAEPAVPTVALTYVDGADSGSNDRAMEQLRNAVRGERVIALRAGGMQAELARALREHMPDLEFEAYAPVVIRFDGKFERAGVGRKRRAASAVVEKNGRPVFRYELPDEVYRVGMSPTSAFARVLADAFAQ